MKRLARGQRHRLLAASAASLVSSLVLGLGLAVLLAQVFGMLAFGMVVFGGFVGVTLLMSNLQRLVAAGAAYPCDQARPAQAWAPPWGPVCFVGLVALVLAQPLLLVPFAFHAEGSMPQARRAMVDLRRQSLERAYLAREASIRAHVEALDEELAEIEALRSVPAEDGAAMRSLRRSGRVVKEKQISQQDQLARMKQDHLRATGPDLADYARHLERSNMPVARLKRLWRRPHLAIPATLVLVLVMQGPLLLRHLFQRTIAAYLEQRLAIDRALIARDYEETREQVVRLLGSWPTFPGHLTPAWSDPPFNTGPAPPLRPRAEDALRHDIDVVLDALKAHVAKAAFSTSDPAVGPV